MSTVTHIASVSAAEVVGAGHTIDLTLPAGILNGDILIATCFHRALSTDPLAAVQPSVDRHVGGFSPGWFYFVTSGVPENIIPDNNHPYGPEYYGGMDSISGLMPWSWFHICDGTESETEVSLGFCDPADPLHPSKAANAIFGISVFRGGLVPQLDPYYFQYARDYNYAGAFPVVYEYPFYYSGLMYSMVAVNTSPIGAIAPPAGWSTLWQHTIGAGANAMTGLVSIHNFSAPGGYQLWGSVGVRDWSTTYFQLADNDLQASTAFEVSEAGASAGNSAGLLAPRAQAPRRNPTVVPPLSLVQRTPNKPWRPTEPIGHPDRMPDAIEERES